MEENAIISFLGKLYPFYVKINGNVHLIGKGKPEFGCNIY